MGEDRSNPVGAARDGRPVLTVAVPAYNVERYLARGLDSLSLPDLAGELEVVVVDDGSTDGTAALAQGYVDAHPRIFRLISQANRGHGGAVNAGMAAARGRYFRIVDGDDWVDGEALAALIGRLRTCEADLVVDARREVDMGTGEERAFPIPEAPTAPHGEVVPFARVLEAPELIPSLTIHGLTARTDYLRAQGIHLLEHVFYEDFEYVVKASAPAGSILFLDEEVYRYLVGNASQSVSRASYVRRWDDHARVVDEMLRYLAVRDAAAARGEAGALSPAALAYVRWKVHLIIDTHYNIALLFDGDRRRGRRRAREFRAELRERDADLWRRGEGRYRAALALNLLGISYGAIERLVAGRRR